MSSSELALEASESVLDDISAPGSPSSSSQALALTANSSHCTSPQFSPPQFLNEDDEEEEQGEEGEEEDDGEEDLQNLQNLQNLQDLQEATEAPMENDENVTSLNLSSKQPELNDSSANSSTNVTASNNEHHHQEEEEEEGQEEQELLLQQQLDSINNSGNCSSRSSSCSRSSSNGSVKQHQQQQHDQQHEQQSSTSPPSPPLPVALTVVNNNSTNNHNLFSQFAESHDLSNNGIGLPNNVSASALAAAAAFRVGHSNNSHSGSSSSKTFHHHKPESSGISRGKSSKSHIGGGSGNSGGNQLSYAADYSSVPNPQSPDFVQLLLEYRQVLLDMLAKSITLNTDADYTAVGSGGDPKSVNLPLKCQCGFTSKLSNQITRSSTYVHQLELRFRSLMEASRATEAKYTPKRPNFINSASQAFAAAAAAVAGTSKGSLLDKKAAHLSRQAASAAAAASSAGKPVSSSMLFAGRSGASSINSSLNGDDGDEGDADSEEDDVNEDDHMPGSLNLANFNGAVGSLVEEMNGGAGGGSAAAAAAGGASGNAGGKTILEGYLESMKNHLPSEDGGSEEDEAGARKMMMVNQMGGGGGEDNELDGLKRIDLQTKRIIAQMITSGISVSDISRNIGVSRKAVKQIVANYRAYGMLEKKRESRIQKGMQSLVVKLYAQGRSVSEISRATNISKPTISKIIKQYADSNLALSAAQGPNGFVVQHNGVSSLPNMKSHGEMQHFTAGNTLDDDMDDEEKEMVVDEDAGDEDDFDDDEDEEMAMKNAHANMLSAGTAFPLALTKQQQHHHHQQQQQPPMKKQRTAMSLIHNSFNNGNGSGGAFNLHAQQSPQQAHMNSNGNSTHQQQQQLLQSQLSLFQERFNNSNSGAGKSFDMKNMRHSNHGGLPMLDLLSQSQHGHRKSSHIVPQSDNSAKLNAFLRHQQQQQQKQHLQQQQQQQQQQLQLQQQQQQHMRMNSSSPRGENHHRMKSMKAMNHRLSNEMSIKESIMSMPEADKNNNTTLANCNTMTISASGAPPGLALNGNALAAMGGHMSNSSSGQHSPSESSALMQPMAASMGDSNSDSEGNMMARPFSDSFPAGIMNSLNPNRATKLTLEDFNVVWQLRSQHWTHNQIRKYFEQRGKSISKSSISRIMNGKQRNFQQFFNVIPSTIN